MAHTVNNLPTMEKAQVRFLNREDPLEEEITIHSWIVEILPGESHGWRSLAGYNPWGRKGWDITEQKTLSLPSILTYLFFNWRIIALQCHVSFFCPRK